MENITVKEYAELKGITERHARRLIAERKLEAVIDFGAGGTAGKSYMIPLASIEPKLIKKHLRIHGQQDKGEKKVPMLADLEKLTYGERQEIAFWKGVLTEWREYRGREPGRSVRESDGEFVGYLRQKYPGRQFSPRILQRKWNAMQAQGDAALVDMRGKHGNHARAVPGEVFDIFEYYYLDESRKSVRNCIRLTELYLESEGRKELLPLATSATFSREILRGIPTPVLKYFREGEKAFRDRCGPYIMRSYDDLDSNDIWVCDNHTFDVFVDDGEHRKPVRVYLTGFQDVRSRKMVGWYVTMNPSSDATLVALRRAIEEYGIPKRILADNGREFLTFDIGGRGFRKSADDGMYIPPTILDNLGIEFRTAMVRNARAKIIERAFRDVKEDFSKLFDGYTGGTVAERPERLKRTGKDAANFTPLEEFTRYVDVWIRGWFNRQPHTGQGMNGRTRDEVYAACLVEKRTATREQLNLMMLRNTRAQKVQRAGVYLSMYDTKVYWNSVELLYSHIGESVYFRYNPDNLSEVRVYDEQDRFLCTAQQVAALSYFADKKEVAEAMKKSRELEKLVRAYKKQKGAVAEDALRLEMDRAVRNLAEPERLDPKIITPVRYMDRHIGEIEPDYAGEDTLDYTEALERLAAAK